MMMSENKTVFEEPEHEWLHRAPKPSTYNVDAFYSPYLKIEKDYKQALLDLKNKLERKIAENLKERGRRTKQIVGEDIYQPFGEIKSKIESAHLDPLRGVDLKIDACLNMNGEKSNHRVLILNGDSTVGKTALVQRIHYGKMFLEYTPVIEDYYTCKYESGCEIVTNFNFKDTPGQEDYDRLRPILYKDAEIFLLCFSIVSNASFYQIHDKWIPEIKHYQPDVPIILMGCKIDLRKVQKVVNDLKFKHFTKPISFSEGERIARSTGCCTYIETSAYTGEGNITDLTEIAAKTIIYYHHQRELFTSKKKCQLM